MEPLPSRAPRTNLLYRFLLVAALTLLLLAPLGLIGNIIAERSAFRAEATARVVHNTSGAQRFLGPLLVIPWTDRQEVWLPNEQNVATRQVQVTTGHLLRTPTALELGGELLPSAAHVGLYQVNVYEWQGKLSAAFAGGLPKPAADVQRSYGVPYLVFGISDVRGLVGAPVLQVAGAKVALAAGTGVLSSALSGIHAELPQHSGASFPGGGGALAVHLTFALKGTSSLEVVPVGGDNRVELRSSWPHPKFEGTSPRSEISAAGFSALWQVSELASDVHSKLRTSGERGEDIGPAGAGFAANADVAALGVSLVQPVDAYTQADRATKYGILFIALTFVGFALFELVKRLSIHPLQYLLVGLALAIFFLLLISLTEHVPFAVAYATSAAACIGLQAIYLSGVLKSWQRGAGFAALLTALYGVLYALLASENNALLMGSLLLFGVLAAVMAITRKVDWYQVSGAAAPPREPTPAIAISPPR
jgi:inner membrane protein